MLDRHPIVITGGAGLLGRGFCRAVALAGGLPIVADRDLASAEAVVAQIHAETGRAAIAAALDITDEASVRALIAEIHTCHGRIAAVVNNAYPRNGHYGRKLEQVTYADFCDNMGMHVGGYFLVAQQFALYFREQGGGQIINMASIYGVMAPRFDIYADTPMTMPVEYAAIKSAVIHLTKYFAQYFKHDRVRANCISPGGIRDGQPEVFLRRYDDHCTTKGMLDPQDISSVLVFLLSSAGAALNGQNLVVDDGFSL